MQLQNSYAFTNFSVKKGLSSIISLETNTGDLLETAKAGENKTTSILKNMELTICIDISRNFRLSN